MSYLADYAVRARSASEVGHLANEWALTILIGVDVIDAEDSLIRADLRHVSRCPARADFIELSFATEEGQIKWCFPEPPARRTRRTGRLVLKQSRYGLQAHPARADGLGPALQSSSALPMILAGADVYVPRSVVSLRS